MKENPYSLILNTVKQDNNANNGVMIGNVISPNPLIIQIGDLQIDKDNILIADYLKVGYERNYSTNRSIVSGVDKGVMKYTDTLKVGDKLAILQTSNKQNYIIVSRLEEV